MVRFGVGTAVLVASLMTVTLPSVADAWPSRHHHRQHARYALVRGHVIQCVAFARADTGIDLPGNAVNWWDNAAGRYARGNAPEIGSVLNFRANERMRLGHVAVVSAIVNSRMVTIDQSHWNSRGVSRGVNVIDVSPENDWSAVRVALGNRETYGSIYPTFGFIYARPDDGTRVAFAPSTSRRMRTTGRLHEVTLEVAEAPRGVDLSTPGIVGDAPDRELR